MKFRPQMFALMLVLLNGLLLRADSSAPLNIVMILSDDMGHAQPGFTGGNPALTPNLDRLASEGVQR